VPRVSDREPDVLVIGAGVCGLTSAICLAEAGLKVTIRTHRLPDGTTSMAAGAIWGPHLAEGSERVSRWSRDSLLTLCDLAEKPGTGVQITSGGEAWRQPVQPPDWGGVLADFRLCTASELPAGYVTGWQYSAPVLDMPVYLGYLLDRFTGSGGDVQVSAVGSLAEAAALAPVVVNCTGIGARDLVPDPEVRPVRGQAVIVTNPGIDRFFIGSGDETVDISYMFPHGDTVLLGGTEQDGNADTSPDRETSQRILAACAVLEPRLAGAEIVAERVGLRPFRPQIRFETERLDGGRLLLHNYGHGGAGVTLSWACARDITAQILNRT
jgi:D-amino-acid oxidase